MSYQFCPQQDHSCQPAWSPTDEFYLLSNGRTMTAEPTLVVILFNAVVFGVVMWLLNVRKASRRWYYLLLPVIFFGLDTSLAWAYGLSGPIVIANTILLSVVTGLVAAWSLTTFSPK